MLFVLLAVSFVQTLGTRLYNGPTNEKKTEAMKISVVPATFNFTVNAVCPDPAFSCPGTETCCPSSTDTGWGCCPSPDLNKIEIIPVSEHLVNPKKSISTYSPICADPTYSCPGDSTCCPANTPSGFGCCSFPDAVCCPDLTRCCQNGYTCVEGGCA